MQAMQQHKNKDEVLYSYFDGDLEIVQSGWYRRGSSDTNRYHLVPRGNSLGYTIAASLGKPKVWVRAKLRAIIKRRREKILALEKQIEFTKLDLQRMQNLLQSVEEHLP